MNLSDNEKRDVIKYLEAGKPLPEKYRFLLFGETEEVELLWNGKTNEVTNVVLPFQIIEQIDVPRTEQFGNPNLGTLFDTSGRQITGWTNKLIWGDNKLILSSLKNGPLRKEIEAQGGLKLIYIDPPFDVGADFSMDIKIGDGEGEESFTKRPSVIEEIAYRDTWGKGADSFIEMIYERLRLMHELLAEDGSIYVHCDYRVNSIIRLALDEIFGKDRIVNEIIWWYKRWTGTSSTYQRMHDTILFYSKSEQYIFNQLFQPLAPSTALVHGDTRRINVKNEEGKLVTIKTEEPSKGVQLHDVWELPFVVAHSQEQVDYPTQKPIELMGRIIDASSNPGDLVADFFCGSGSFMAAAEGLRSRKDGNRTEYFATDSRKWIGSDLGKFSIHTTRKRLIGVQRELKKEGKDFRAFEILNVGRYERENFVAVNDDLRAEEKAKQAERKEKEFIKLILTAYKAEPLDTFKNFVGKKRDRMVAIGPINLPASSKFIDFILEECVIHKITKVDVLGFDYEMGLDVTRAKDFGVDIALKIIPREVFDARAVERGQVKFYDVAYLEAKPIISGKGNSKEVKIELTDFSCSYSQDDITEIIEGLKPGGSKIILDSGKLIKVSKDKVTEDVTQDILTKKWSDWIDYWAVDFNFASRKEIIKVIEKGEEKEVWTGDYIFDNEWQSFRTKKNRNLELTSVVKEVSKGAYKVAVKVVDIFGNDTTKVIEVKI